MRAVLALCFALSLWLVPLRAAIAEPAMWAVTDSDSTVYLFGTFHALPADMDWRSEKIDRAFAASSDLWLEVVLDDSAATQEVVAKLGLDFKTPLIRKLSILERRQFSAALRAASLPSAALRNHRPWLAAITLLSAVITQSGFDPQSGADRQFESAALAAGKPVRALETVEQQMRIFANLDAETELELLRQTMAELEKGPAYLKELARVWGAGDVAGLEQATLDGVKAQSAELYASIFTNRNADWVRQIEELMAGEGTHFIAVGAGHLVGAEGVPAMLSARGFTVARQ